MTTVLMGTVALEPNRWGTIDPSGRATTTLSGWLPALAAAGFDGLEVWERHLLDAAPAEVDAVVDGPLPVRIWNTYASFDDPDPAGRDRAAAWVRRVGASAVKFNVGADPAAAGAYAERIAAWLEALGPDVTALCECHAGISIAEDPATAATILAAAGPPGRVGAIVHTHEDLDHLRARFDAYGERIAHVHVNFLDPADGLSAPPLEAVADRLAERVELLAGLGFAGTWTLEFVEGVLTDHDRPDHLVDRAVADLVVLRAALG